MSAGVQKLLTASNAFRFLGEYSFSTANTYESQTGNWSISYTGADLGVPAGNRYILGVVYTASSSSGGTVFTGASFGGVTASLLVAHYMGFNHNGYFLAAVPGGTSGTLTWSGTCTSDRVRGFLVTYAIYATSRSGVSYVTGASSTSSTTSASSRSVSLASLQPNDLVFASGGNNSNGAHSYTPAYLGIDFDQSFNAASRRRTVASGVETTSGSRTVTANFTTSAVQATLSAIALRP